LFVQITSQSFFLNEGEKVQNNELNSGRGGLGVGGWGERERKGQSSAANKMREKQKKIKVRREGRRGREWAGEVGKWEKEKR
jgi:hypothetical protein